MNRRTKSTRTGMFLLGSVLAVRSKSMHRTLPARAVRHRCTPAPISIRVYVSFPLTLSGTRGPRPDIRPMNWNGRKSAGRPVDRKFKAPNLPVQFSAACLLRMPRRAGSVHQRPTPAPFFAFSAVEYSRSTASVPLSAASAGAVS